MIKIGVVKSDDIGSILQPSCWAENDWQVVNRFGTEYKVITSFSHYFDGIVDDFDKVFTTSEAYEQWLLSEWHEPDWKYRINITKEQLGYLTLNYFDLVLSLNTEPINPRYDLGDNVLVYINNITAEGQLVLDSMCIKVDANLN